MIASTRKAESHEPSSRLFPLTPALSPGEREDRSARGLPSKRFGCSRRFAGCSLCLRERVRGRVEGMLAVQITS
mgnify:CR=1 FL=1